MRFLKAVLPVFLFLILSVVAFAQTTQKGTAYRYNGEKPRTGLQGVLIQCDEASNNNVLTASDGSFTLTLPSLKAGDPLENVRISKKGMIVMNREAVAEWSVRKTPLTVVLRDADEYKKEKDQLEKVTQVASRKIYEKKKEELERELSAGIISKKKQAEELAALQASVEEFRKQSKSYSSFLVGIDLREVTPTLRQALELVREGNPEAAAFLLEGEDFPKRILEQSSSGNDSRQDVLGARVLLAIYRFCLDWKKYENLLEQLTSISEKPEVHIEYGNHLVEKGLYHQGIVVLEQKTQYIDKRNNPQWYLSATNWLTEAYAATGDNEKAIRLAEETVSFIDSLGEDEMEEGLRLLFRASFMTIQSTAMASLHLDNEDITRKTIIAARRASRSDYSSEGTSLLITVLGSRLLSLLQQDRKEEAESIEKELDSLLKDDPNGFVENVATLNIRLLLAAGDKKETERILRENIDVCWGLAKDTPWKFEPVVANFEYLLASSLMSDNPGKRKPEVEELLDESIDILRRYSNLSPEFHAYNLAQALRTLSFYFRLAGKVDGGVIADAREAMDLTRPFAEKEPQQYGKQMALCVSNYAECINKTVEINHPDKEKVLELVKYEEEAVDCMKQLGNLTDMEKHDYVTMLLNLAISNKIYLGNTRESNRLIKEATSICEDLARNNPTKFGQAPEEMKKLRFMLLLMKKGSIRKEF